MIRGGERREKEKERTRGRGRPRPSARHLRTRRSRTRKTRGVRERTTRTPRWTTGGAGAREGENEQDQRGRERNGYHRQAILVALQTGKTTRNSVSETRPLLAEDEFRSFCSRRDSQDSSREFCPTNSSSLLEFRERVDAIFFRVNQFRAIRAHRFSYKIFAVRLSEFNSRRNRTINLRCAFRIARINYNTRNIIAPQSSKANAIYSR